VADIDSSTLTTTLNVSSGILNVTAGAGAVVTGNASASVIITGLSSEIAQTLVTIGVDLSKMNAVGDLQGGIEEAELLLGYKVMLTDDQTAREPQA